LSEDFSLYQQLSEGSTVITTTSEHTGTDKAISVSYYSNNRIRKQLIVCPILKHYYYTYNNNDLTSIITLTEDVFMNNSSVEAHQWFYENNMPTKMLLIKNNIDTIVLCSKKIHQGILQKKLGKERKTN